MGKKYTGMQYVKDFEFPSEQGFSGSAGKHQVKGYMRGGHVKKDPVKAAAQKKRAEGPGAARGGDVGIVTKRQPRQSRPKNTMTAAAQGGSVHDKLYAHGGKMGYAKGGYAASKNTSKEFVQKNKPMDSMDHGTDPGKPHNQAEKEAGGRKRTLPKLARGGRPKPSAPNPDHTKGKGKSMKGMPKSSAKHRSRGVMAEGGKVGSQTPATTKAKAKRMGLHKSAARRAKGTTRSARGGLAQMSEGGLLKRAATGLVEHESRTKEAVNRALADSGRSGGKGQGASRAPKVADKPPARPSPRGIYREDKQAGVPRFTDVPKVGKKVR